MTTEPTERTPMPDALPMKRCIACGLTKILDCFGRDARAPDGRNARCLQCKRLKDQRERGERVQGHRWFGWKDAPLPSAGDAVG